MIPVDALIKRGYKDIIMVRIFGVGREKRIEIPGDVNMYSIEPRVDLGNIIDFNSEKSRRNMVTGYYDAQRFLYGLAGSIYYIEQTHEQCYYLKQLTSVKQEILIGLSEEYRLDPDPDMQLRNLLEVLLPVFAGELRLSKEWTYGELYLGILEATARLLEGANTLEKVELLRYNKAAGAKYSGVGMTYAPDFPEQQEPRIIRAPFERRGIRVDIL